MSSNLWSSGRSCARESVSVVRFLLLAAVVVVATTSVCLGIVITKINASRDGDNKITASISLGGDSGCSTNADCADGNVCNGIESCDGTECFPGTPLECDDEESCTVDTCNSGSGCVNTWPACSNIQDFCCGPACTPSNDSDCIFFRESPIPELTTPSVGTVSTNTACDTIAVAVVVDDGQTINILSVNPGNVKASPVDAAHQTLLANELSALGLFDDSTQDLFFTLYNPPNPCTNIKVTVEFTIKGTAPGSDPKAVDRLVAAGTNLKDLENAVNNNVPLNNIEFVDAPIIGTDDIPAASTWGLVVLGLALLVGARLRFGGRKAQCA